jgi:hypothetical protein
MRGLRIAAAWAAKNELTALAVAGLVLVAAGLSAVHWALASVVCGGLMLVGAVMGALYGSTRKNSGTSEP